MTGGEERPGSAGSSKCARIDQEVSLGYNSVQEWVETTSARHTGRHPESQTLEDNSWQSQGLYPYPAHPGQRLMVNPKQYDRIKGTRLVAGAPLLEPPDSFSPLSDSAAALRSPLRTGRSTSQLRHSYASQQEMPDETEPSWLGRRDNYPISSVSQISGPRIKEAGSNHSHHSQRTEEDVTRIIVQPPQASLISRNFQVNMLRHTSLALWWLHALNA